ncbi:unnamed protein product [Anisakis simplex]|uniref:Ground-like domain-containing protein n=1 Tax=Anisakis simplex TaxID=6269 RepID=A0A0M3J9U0_ANISI|nr:unnamed protein product [Anisakis simplex]
MAAVEWKLRISGFLCCNGELLRLIDVANRDAVQRNYSECNTHIVAQTLQENAERRFNTTFEIIVSTGDFASKTHFRDDLLCKDFIYSKYVLIYATPIPYPLSEQVIDTLGNVVNV